IDAFAARSYRYDRASSTAPICAPARTTIITGMYAPSLGAQHMRSRVHIPSWFKLLPEQMKTAGYYCTNNSKQDYNLILGRKIWHESSRKAHWKNRPENKPFFAVFNTTVSHESQIRNANPHPKHDPAKAPLPPYHPDTPEVRKDWAQYYDRLSGVDAFVKKHLDALEKEGLSESTIVFFYADHGSGMPRHKRYVGWSGLHVPLLVHVPEKYKHLAPENYQSGGSTDRLVGFVDLAPTALSIAGVKPPKWQQGGAFMGKHSTAAPKYSFGFRGRADERPDSSRSVTDGRYIYIRNYYPHLPHGVPLDYQMQTPTTRIWYNLFKQGKLNAVQAAFWKPRAVEELYDLSKDPHETKNLTTEEAHLKKLTELRAAHQKHLISTRDTALLPESLMHQLATKHQSPPYRIAKEYYELERLIRDYTQLQLLGRKAADDKIKMITGKPTPQREYWKLTYLLSQSNEVVRKHMDSIMRYSGRSNLRLELIARAHLDEKQRAAALAELVRLSDPATKDLYTCIESLNSLTRLQPLPKNILTALSAQPNNVPNPGFAKNYIPRLRENLGLNQKKTKNKKRKNVLFIIADDLNCDIGCYGHTTAHTPFIDRLAKQSLRFTHAYNQNPRCNPSRTSFLTGIYPSRTGVMGNGSPHFRKKHPDIVTLPQHFKNNGYFTARVGKIYHYGVPSQIGTDGEDDPASWSHVVNPRGIDREVLDKVHTLQKGQFGGTLSWLKLPSTHRKKSNPTSCRKMIAMTSLSPPSQIGPNSSISPSLSERKSYKHTTPAFPSWTPNSLELFSS
ncbi:MAG: sulfatase-like hydrolase/transferase, partial [Akkermansiaceae bacterium]